jgi:indolepyruvate ferredoxin oxidoreductase
MAPGGTIRQLSLNDKYSLEEGDVLLTGIQAIIRVVLDQRRADRLAGFRTATFISGYPGSPVAGIDSELGRIPELIRDFDIVYQPGLNEELGATAVAGSQVAGKALQLKYDGIVGMWYGKAPGLDRAADAIRHANYSGVTRTSGALAWVGDDPACKSSTIPSSSEQSLADMFSPVLDPGNVQEVLDYGLHGVALSRVCSLWTGMKIVTNVADAMGTATVRRGGVCPVLPGGNGHHYGREQTIDISFAARLAAEQEIVEVRLPAALAYASANHLNEVTVEAPDAWLAIVVPSHTYYELRGALKRLGLGDHNLRANGIRILKLGMLFPFDAAMVRDFVRGVEQVLVIEERRPFLENHVRNALYGMTDAPRVVGKADETGAPLIPGYGALDADLLSAPLRTRLGQRLGDKLAPLQPERTLVPLAVRPPYFCSGCPHSTGTRVPKGTLIGTGIGCHGMVGWMTPDTVGKVTSYTQMGGEGAQFIGIAPFVKEGHFTQNVGDGTFFHSGQLAVHAAIAAGLNMTFKILFNDTIAMTGGQDAPGRLDPAGIADVLLGHGASKIVITTDDVRRYRRVKLPHGVAVEDRSRIIEVQEELARVPGVTVLIHDQRCAAEARRMRKRGQLEDPPMRVSIIERVCEGCGDCSVKSNCMSVQTIDTDLGSKRIIDQTSCNKDYSCLGGDCPSFVTLMPRRTGMLSRVFGTRVADAPAPSGSKIQRIESDSLPDPQLLFSDEDFAVRMTGVGGTGVVTVSQVLVTAARIAGLEARSMDQTGLAQKGGAVVSDVRISRRPIERGAKIDARGADLYLAFDTVVGALPANLAAADETRTLALVSTSMTMTGEQIGRSGAPVQDPTPFVELIADAGRAEMARTIDSAAICRRLFGDTSVANVFMMGTAYQLGGLPIQGYVIEQALELNGVAVEKNIQAFRWGRRWAIAPDELQPRREQDPVTLPGNLEQKIRGITGPAPALFDIIAWRTTDLVAYQNERLASDFVAFLDRVSRRSDEVRPGETALIETVARNLYKLMAYKDEYEVARLLLDASAARDIAAASGGKPMRFSWNLQPPMLRSLGLKKKLRLGPWFKPAFVSLHSLRHLRGTPFDVFGYAKVRRVERALIREYRTTIEKTLARLTDENLDRAVVLAGLPDLVRGYEHIKLANVARYRSELRTAFDGLDAPMSEGLAS